MILHENHNEKADKRISIIYAKGGGSSVALLENKSWPHQSEILQNLELGYLRS